MFQTVNNRGYIFQWTNAGQTELIARQCTRCSKVKVAAHFPVCASRPGGRYPVCRTCRPRRDGPGHPLTRRVVVDGGSIIEAECSICHRVLPVDAFTHSKKGYKGRIWRCRECSTAMQGERRVTGATGVS